MKKKLILTIMASTFFLNVDAVKVECGVQMPTNRSSSLGQIPGVDDLISEIAALSDVPGIESTDEDLFRRIEALSDVPGIESTDEDLFRRIEALSDVPGVESTDEDLFRRIEALPNVPEQCLMSRGWQWIKDHKKALIIGGVVVVGGVFTASIFGHMLEKAGVSALKLANPVLDFTSSSVHIDPLVFKNVAVNLEDYASCSIEEDPNAFTFVDQGPDALCSVEEDPNAFTFVDQGPDALCSVEEDPNAFTSVEQDSAMKTTEDSQTKIEEKLRTKTEKTTEEKKKDKSGKVEFCEVHANRGDEIEAWDAFKESREAGNGILKSVGRFIGTYIFGGLF